MELVEYRQCWAGGPGLQDAFKRLEKQAAAHVADLEALDAAISKVIAAEGALQQAYDSASKVFQHVGAHLDKDTAHTSSLDLGDTCRTLAEVARTANTQRKAHMKQLGGKVLKHINEEREQLLEQGKVLRANYKQEQQRYFAFLDKYLSVSARKAEQDLSDMEAKCTSFKQAWAEAGMKYAQYLNLFQLSKGVIAGHVIGFVQSMGLASTDCKEAVAAQQELISSASNTVECIRTANEEQAEVSQRSMRDTLNLDEELLSAPINGIKRGYLMLQTSRLLGVGVTWIRCFCIYDKAAHRFFCHTDDSPDCTVVEVDSCVQKFSDEIDRKFAFQVSGDKTTLVLQASSDADRKAWIAAMGGLAPVKTVRRKKGRKQNHDTQWQELRPQSVEFLQKMMAHVERSYLDFEGLYRVSGTKTRYVKLYTDVLQKNKQLSLADEDVTVVTSCLKYFLRQMPEPLLTRGLYTAFIDAVRDESKSEEERLEALRAALDRLPRLHYNVAKMLIAHLSKVATRCKENKMTTSNLAVVFGPTMLQAPSTSGGMLNLTHQNSVVETMIRYYHILFDSDSERPASSAIDKLRSQLDAIGLKSADATNTSSGAPAAPAAPAAPPLSPPSQSPRPAATRRLSRRKAVQKKPMPLPPHAVQRAAGDRPAAAGRTPPKTPPPPMPKTPPPPMPKAPSPPETRRTAAPTLQVPATHPPPVPPKPRSMWTVRALYDCEADDEEEITFLRGDIITDVEEGEDEGWLVGTLQSTQERGLFPQNYVHDVFNPAKQGSASAYDNMYASETVDLDADAPGSDGGGDEEGEGSRA